ncbi:MAG: hypothetical protein AVDCRST_MAG08-1556, partial [uncultured Acetobacteraceae bacterium]
GGHRPRSLRQDAPNHQHLAERDRRADRAGPATGLARARRRSAHPQGPGAVGLGGARRRATAAAGARAVLRRVAAFGAAGQGAHARRLPRAGRGRVGRRPPRRSARRGPGRLPRAVPPHGPRSGRQAGRGLAAAGPGPLDRRGRGPVPGQRPAPAERDDRRL